MYSVIVGKSAMIGLGVENFLISIKLLFREGSHFRISAHPLGADHKILGFPAIMTIGSSQEIGLDRHIGVIFLHLISAILITISIHVIVIFLFRGKTKGPHT
jgi:hypothetical protein